MSRNLNIKCYFITGTGRCGTKLFSKIFSLSRHSVCEHEKVFRHQSMMEFSRDNNFRSYMEDINEHLIPAVNSYNKQGKSYGVSSGHMYFSIPYLYKILGGNVRFILLVRRPDEFVRSALARGFFDPNHPHSCIPALPNPKDEIFQKWESISPFEKNLWYWNLVNGFVINEYKKIPENIYRVVVTEDINPAIINELCCFLDLKDIDEEEIRSALSLRVNASPGMGDERDLNPWSLNISLPEFDNWSESKKKLLIQYAGRLESELDDVAALKNDVLKDWKINGADSERTLSEINQRTKTESHSQNKKILLIQPWKYHDEGIASHDLSRQWRNGPYALLLLATYLRTNGVPVKLVDLHPELVKANGSVGQCMDYLRQEVAAFRPDIIGVSFFSYQFNEAGEINRVMRELCARLNINPVFIAGGIHASIEPYLTITNLGFDYAFAGEGELGLLALARGESPEGVPGIVSMKERGCRKAETINDLNSLPFPDWGLCDYSFYARPSFKLAMKPMKTLDLMMGRGCVYKCSFCAYSALSRVRYYSPEYLVEQIQEMKQRYGIDSFYFIDSSIGNNRKLLERFCELIITSEIAAHMVWYANIRANQVDEALLRLLWDAGCRALLYGFESGSQKILDRMNKKCSVQDNVNAAELHNKLRFPYHASMILGYPGETEEDVRMTINFMRHVRPPMSGVNWYVPLPGSSDYNELKKKGLIKIEDPHEWRRIGEVLTTGRVYADMEEERFRLLFQEACDLSYKLKSENGSLKWEGPETPPVGKGPGDQDLDKSVRRPLNTFEWALDCECKDLILKVGSRYTEGMKIGKIMDFACGSSEEITKLAPEAEEYYFLDGKFLPAQRPRYFRFMQPASARIPLPDNYLDVVTTNGSFDHFTQEDRIKAFLEIERVLRPGGLLLFACEYIDFQRGNGNIFEMSQKDPDIVGRNCQMYDNIDVYGICSRLKNLKIWQADRSVLPDGRPLHELVTTAQAKYYRGESKCGTEVIWGSFIVVFSKEITGGKEVTVTPEFSDESLKDMKEMTAEKNMKDNGNIDYSDFTDRLREKWVEVPGTRQGRVFSSEMLTWPDEKLMEFWEECRAETSVNDVRGWYQELYKDMFSGLDVADVGPGVGIDGIFFAQHGARVTFMDIVEDNLKLLERICRLKGVQAQYYFIDDFFNYRFRQKFDVFMFIGSMINTPLEFARRQAQAMIKFLNDGGSVVMLAYPKERYEKSGARDGAEFGKMTDGERTPWVEWYDDEKITSLFGEHFRLEWSRNFGKDAIEFNWFDLTRLKEGNGKSVSRLVVPGALWMNYKGEHQFINGDTEGSIRTFEAAIEAGPELSTAFNNLGVLHCHAGEIEKSRKYLERALALHPDNRDAVFNYVNVMVALNETEAAGKIYLDYLKNNMEDDEITGVFARACIPGHIDLGFNGSGRIAIPVVSVKDLHKRMGFAAPLDYPSTSLIKPLNEWQMGTDDSPIFRYIYRNHRPGRHLEFGTWQGEGTNYCLEECNATIWTINLPFGEDKTDKTPAYGHYPYEIDDVKSWAKKAGFSDQDSYRTDSIGFIGRRYLTNNMGHRVCQIYCDSRQWDISNYPQGMFDSALVDGGHIKDVVINDTRKSLQLLRRGGIIIWHDFCPSLIESNENARGVAEAICSEIDFIRANTTDLFWIYPSWILIGRKK